MNRASPSPSRIALRALCLASLSVGIFACGGSGREGAVGPTMAPPPAPTAPPIPAGNVSQYPPYGTQFTPTPYSTGMLANAGDEPLVADAYVLRVPDAVSLRVIFEEVRLDEGSAIEVWSPHTDETMTFSAAEAERWGNTTGHFMGDMLEIRLVLAPHTQGSFTIHGVFDGLTEMPAVIEPQSQCGGTDDRIPSGNPFVGRLDAQFGCTIWLANFAATENGLSFSAGHCFSFLPSGFPNVVEFNVPLSNPDTTVNFAPVRDQYPLAPGSLTFVDNPLNSFDIPDDWAIARIGTNNLGETAVSRQGTGLLIDEGSVFPVFPLLGDPITVTGYGTDAGTANQTLQQHTGPYQGSAGFVLNYQVDTEGGNSGGVVFSDFDGRAIGIHTNAGCGADGLGNPTGANAGVSLRYGPIVTATAATGSKAAPVITGPANQALECDGGGAATPTFLFPTSDPDGEVVLVEFRVDGVLSGVDVVPGAGNASFTFSFPIGGPYIVVGTATNATGTQDSHTFEVTVADTTPPLITCPADILAECTGPGGTVVTYPPIAASDACAGVVVVAVPPSGSVFPNGTTIVTVTATDGVGNVAVCQFNVTIQDTTPPVLTSSIKRSFLWLPQNGLVDVGLTATAVDVCGGVLPITVTVFSDEDVGALPYTPDAAVVGIAPNQRLQLRAQRDAVVNNGRWYIVVVSAVDGVGNAVQQAHVVVVPYNLTTAQINAIRALANAQLPVAGPPPVPPLGSFTLLSSPFN